MKNRIGIVLLGAMLLAGTASLPVQAINYDSTDGKYWYTVNYRKIARIPHPTGSLNL